MMKYLKEYNNSSDKEEFLKNWDIIETLKDCFIEYSDKYDVIIEYANYRKRFDNKEHTELNMIADINLLYQLDNYYINEQIGYRIVSRLYADRNNRDYNLENINKISDKLIESSCLFSTCCSKIRRLIDNDINYMIETNKDGYLPYYTFTLYVYPKKKEMLS